MASNQLSTGFNRGDQTTTQDPQLAGQPALASNQSSGVQPGTATSILNGQGIIPLRGTPLNTVRLTSTTPARQVPPPRHPNYPLFAVSILLCAIAIYLFWYTGRSAKTTT